MILHLVITTAITVALVLGWALVQALVRRSSPEMGDDDDVLACRMCSGDGNCQCGLRMFRKERGNHETTHAA